METTITTSLFTKQYCMGNQQSVAKAVAKTKAAKPPATFLVFADSKINPEWIPEDAHKLPLLLLKLSNVGFLTIDSVILACSTLVSLDLANNKLASISGIHQLWQLSHLDVSGNSLDYLPDGISSLYLLAQFKCSQNQLTLRSFPAVFFDLPNLHLLDIS